MKIVSRILVFMSLTAAALGAPPPEFKPNNSNEKSLDLASYINANYLLMITSNVGSIAYDQGAYFGKLDGLYYPYTTIQDIIEAINNKTVVFAGGIWIAGIDSTSGDTLVSVAEYTSTFFPGPIVNGTYVSNAQNLPQYRVYKLYADSQAAEPNQDYLDWPSSDGAPTDIFGNPKVFGEQTLFCVYNDANPAFHDYHAATSQGLGIEIQQTIWGVNSTGAEGYSVYSRHKLLNKSANHYKDFFIALWFDPDIGAASDDRAGCDTLENIFFSYNNGSDAVYGTTVPAFGVRLLEGPTVLSYGDTAYVDGLPVPQSRNLGMYSFMALNSGDDPSNPRMVYQFMNGLNAALGGIPLPNGTRFEYPGDPFSGTGDIDPAPSDRRILASFGPFDFPAGDSQQVIVKIGVGQGGSSLSSLAALRNVLQVNNLPFDTCCVGSTGDLNGDTDEGNILDLTYLVDRMFRGGPRPGCPYEADVNSDGKWGNLLDLTYLVDFIYRGGPAPMSCGL